MKIETDKSYLLAQKVLSEVRKLTAGKGKGSVGTGPWRNGREQGILIWGHRNELGSFQSIYIAIAENRSSEKVTIYLFHHAEFCTGHPTDSQGKMLVAWEPIAHHFGGINRIEKAAVFISIELLAFLK